MDPAALDRPVMAFSIPEEISKVLRSRKTAKTKHAQVLTKNAHVRIVLAVLSGGEMLEEHATEGQITVSVIQGTIRFNALDEQVDLIAGGLLTLQPGVRHSVLALEDAAFVVTVCAPSKKAAQ
jgi:quercetin dioxygenase-like cupin family protein